MGFQDDPIAKLRIHLVDGGLQHRLDPDGMAGQGARQFQVVVAQQEQAPLAVDQVEHDAQGAGAVRPMVGQVAELNDEAVGRGGVGEGGGLAVHVADDPDPGVGGDEGCGHHTAVI